MADNTEAIEIPPTLEAAVKDVIKHLPADDRRWVSSDDCTEDGFVAKCHFGLGRWMRNNWGLWSGKSDLYKDLTSKGFTHADDMSGVILTSVYRELNNLPWEIEEERRKYEEHWKKYGDPQVST